MSRAFVSEDAAAAHAAELPERPAGTGANPVTPRGMALIEAELARLRSLHDATVSGDAERASVDRDLRYWQARRATATLVPPLGAPPRTVVFGSHVTLRRPDGLHTYQIVGEDEADPSADTLSWTSPLADALLGAEPGELVEIGDGRAPVTVVSVRAEAEKGMAAQSGGDCAA